MGFVNSVKKLQRREISSKRDRAITMSDARERFYNIHLQVSKALLAEFMTAQKRSKPFKAMGSEHMNKPFPVIPSNLTSSTLQSLEFQMDAFCLRERDLLNRFIMEVS